MIKVISFDIGGTILLSNNNDDKYSLKELQKMIGLPYNLIRTSYKEVFQKQKGTLLELANSFCDLLDIALNDEIIDFFKNKFSEDNIMNILNADILSVMNQLKDQGYKIVLFSNSCCLIGNDNLNDVMKYVDDIYYSYDIGYTKDDIDSYRYIENELNIKSNEFLHIGDTLSCDYIMPREAGWNSLFYGKIDNSEIDSIKSLMEIFNYLK